MIINAFLLSFNLSCHRQFTNKRYVKGVLLIHRKSTDYINLALSMLEPGILQLV